MLSIAALACVIAGDVAAPRAPGAALFVGPSVDFSLAVPTNGATMPTNARLLAFGQFFDETGRGAADVDTEVAFERVLSSGERVALVDVEMAGTTINGRAYLVDLGDLVAGETVTVVCDLCFDQWSATVVDAVDEEPPAFGTGNKNAIDVTDMGADVGYQVRACIPAPIDAAGGNVALRVITDVSDGYAPAQQGGVGIGGCRIDEVDVAVFAPGDARTFCFQTLAVDGAGNESLFHENVCAELPEHASAGCAQTDATPLGAACVLLALRRGRRRAGRT